VKLNFLIRINPRGKGRPRFAGGHAYTDAATRKFERAVKMSALGYMAQNGFVMFPESVPLKAEIIACFAFPKTWQTKNFDATAHYLKVTKPDADNVLKAVLDALNGVCYTDDNQVADAHIVKQWALEPGIIVKIEEAMP
jgi:Holliday junction resolvase RusA-like endonuclease